MLNNWYEKGRLQIASPVELLLARVKKFGYAADDYVGRVRSYLEWARWCGLGSQDIAYSCIDLAETLTDIPEVAVNRRAKIIAWEGQRQAALAAPRPPRFIDMELDPVYFEAILIGAKIFEGRAYKPDSDKNYPDIRVGDHIRFTLSQRKEEFGAEYAARNLRPDTAMLCTVREVYFAPTVHGMYQLPKFDGDAFQPMVNGVSEAIQLQRAAVYHMFPDYHELIGAHGFLGIQLEYPHLVAL